MDKTILLVDEAPSFRALLGGILRDRGYGVIEAADGREALAVLEEELPDLMVIEAVLPYKSGFEVCGAMRRDKRWRRVPILLMCSIPRSPHRPDAHWRDLSLADEFLTKPFGLLELLERVEGLLGSVLGPRS